MGSAGMNLHIEAERIRQVLRDPRMPLGQALADAITLLTYASEQLATLEDIGLLQTENARSAQEIQRLRGENMAMRGIVQQLAQASNYVLQYKGNIVSLSCPLPNCRDGANFGHTPECLISKAKAALTLYPG